MTPGDLEQMRRDAAAKMGNPATSVWHAEFAVLSGHVEALLVEVERLRVENERLRALLLSHKIDPGSCGVWVPGSVRGTGDYCALEAGHEGRHMWGRGD